MKYIRYFLTFCTAGTVSFLGMVSFAHAETHISDGFLGSDIVWTASDSPIVLDDMVTVPVGHTLTVLPGVSITSHADPEYAPNIFVNGELRILGTAQDPVTISDIGNIQISNGKARIEFADIHVPGGIGFYGSVGLLSSTTIHNASQAITVKSSQVDIVGSDISHNLTGIYLPPPPPVLMMKTDDRGVGGLGNALETQSTPYVPGIDQNSLVQIRNTTFRDNAQFSINNAMAEYVDAIGNWWGNDSGPLASSSNSLQGKILYDPWLRQDPKTIPTKLCCSSVLFIPGIEGTRLYGTEVAPLGLGTHTTMLWEPALSSDVKRLYMNQNGTSKDASIFSGEPIGRVFENELGIGSIYGSFMKFLDRLRDAGTISEWRSFGYDWRRSIQDIVSGPEKKATTTESLMQVVQDLAQRSPTGKINIIAHSMGGLVAKELIRTLVDAGKSNIIDQVISVAVPNLGTPSSLSSLLHGDGLEMLYGAISTAATGRGLAINSPSIYSLLPSQQYFSSILSPSIAFATTSMTTINHNAYPLSISKQTDQTAFILDSQKSRKKASVADVTTPAKGNASLLAAAGILHASLDAMTLPTAIGFWSIVGWGTATTKTLSYAEDKICAFITLQRLCPSHQNVTTQMGDGTVIAPSAAFNSGKVISADLRAIGQRDGAGAEHATILESSTTQHQIQDIITAPASASPILEPGMSWGEPDYTKDASILVASTHSPVELHVYDSEGRHTGPIPTPDFMKKPGSYFTTAYEAKIPGTKYEQQGDANDPVSFVYMPEGKQETYTFVLKGTGVGPVDFELERQYGGEQLGSVHYPLFAVTPLTNATTTYTVSSETITTSSTPIASKPLRIDVDGNGSVDITATTSSEISLDANALFDKLQAFVKARIGDTKKGQQLCNRIEKVAVLARKGKLRQLHDVGDRLAKRVDHMKYANLSTKDRDWIINMIDIYVSQFE